MNHDTLIRKIAEADAYAPELELPRAVREPSVVLSEIHRRIEMDLKEVPPVTDDQRNRGWLMAAAAFAVVVVVVGAVWLFGGGTNDAPPVTTPETVTSTTEASATEEQEVPSTTTPESTETTVAAGDNDGILTIEFDFVPKQTWRVESLGTPFDVDIEGDWFVQPNTRGWTVFSHYQSIGPGDRDVVFFRPSALSDPSDPLLVGIPGWSVGDLETWLTSMADVLDVTPPVAVEVGGVPGLVFDVEVTPDVDCTTVGEENCVKFVRNALDSDLGFAPGFRYTVYWLEQGDFDPIVIAIGARVSIFDDWKVAAEALLANVTFGEPRMHPAG